MIHLQGIGRDFEVGSETVHALRDIELEVEPGEYLSVMGPSGSGKSTLLNVIGLLDRPTAGRYELDGRDVTGLDDREAAKLRLERIGFVFQTFHLVHRLDCFENAALPLVLAGVPPAEREPRVRETLESLGLGKRARHRPSQLSGGERQRVAIARAIIMKPALLLADEPTGNLDTASGNEVIGILERLNDSGIALMVVTHDRDLGARSRRALRMVDGAIVYDGPTDAAP